MLVSYQALKSVIHMKTEKYLELQSCKEHRPKGLVGAGQARNLPFSSPESGYTSKKHLGKTKMFEIIRKTLGSNIFLIGALSDTRRKSIRIRQLNHN